MEDATETPRVSTPAALLAGLARGILGVFWMLTWSGVSAEWQRRSFWTAENLMASAFYGERAIHSGFAGPTVSGLALYLVLYGLLGAAFAALVRDRLPRVRTLLVAIIFSMAWYYVSFRLLWRSMMPLVALLHVERTTAIGHVIFGAVLGGYPRYFRQKSRSGGETAPETAETLPKPAEEATPAPPQSSSEPGPASQSENS